MRNRPASLRRSIQSKITLILALTSIPLIVAGLGAGWFLGSGLLRDTISLEYRQFATLMATHISESLNDQIALLNLLLKSPGLTRAVEEANGSYGALPAGEIEAALLARDPEWIAAGPDDPLLRRYLDTPASAELKIISGDRETHIGEIFITDRHGGLAASSGKTSDFYQADEDWWRQAYADGRGRTYLGGIELDESSNLLSIALAVPLHGADGQVTGICKAVVEVEPFFESLALFNIGRTGHAAIIDGKNQIVFHEGIHSLSARYTSDLEFRKLLDNKEQWGIIDRPHQGTAGDAFYAFARIMQEDLLRGGILWLVIVTQSPEEVYAPLHRLMGIVSLLAAGLLLASVPLVFLSGRAFVRPIRTLHEATERMSKGDLGVRVEILTGDEIEGLALSLNRMASELQASQERIAAHSRELESKVRERTAQLEEAKHGLEGTVEERTRELRDRNEELTRSQTAMLFMIEDLNRQAQELRDAQDKVVRSEKLAAIGQLSSSVAHELRNPLGVMKNVVYYFNMLELGKDSPDIKENLDALAQEIDKSDKIITDLLEFARVKQPALRPENVNVIVQEIVSRLSPGERVTVATALDSELPHIPADALQLQQVFYNLARNAIDAMEEGGTLSIATRRDGDRVLVSFSDTGVGIPKENLTKIFDPLFSTKPKGTGLGLSVCASIVEGHRGDITVASEQGRGTTFTIALSMGEAKKP